MTGAPAEETYRRRTARVLLVDDADRVLLFRWPLRDGPASHCWITPGGGVEPGETLHAAAVRELREETGLDVAVGALAGTVERPGPDGVTYEIHDYTATVTGGTLRAGDDAAEARWVRVDDLGGLPVTPGLVDALRQWGVL